MPTNFNQTNVKPRLHFAELASYVARLAAGLRKDAAKAGENIVKADMCLTFAAEIEAGRFDPAVASALHTLSEDDRSGPAARLALQDTVDRLGFDLFFDEPDGFMQEVIAHVAQHEAKS